MDFDEVKEVVTNREFVLPIKDYGQSTPFMMLQAFSEGKAGKGRGKGAPAGSRKFYNKSKSPDSHRTKMTKVSRNGGH